MKQYLELLEDILDNGVDGEDRTGTGTRSVFGRMIRYDLSEGFPLLTTKKLHFKSIAIELLWFLSGNTNTKFLTDNGVSIWDSWSIPEDEFETKPINLPTMFAEACKLLVPNTFDTSDDLMLHLNRMELNMAIQYLVDKGVKDTEEVQVKWKGDLGPVYGKQWRSWPDNKGGVIDQIANVIKSIKEDPYSRRHIVNSWNVAQLDDMALMPCHYSFQFYVRDGKLSCLWNQRSVDTFIGKPYNIASYALLTHMIAHLCGLEVGDLVFSGADVHLYHNHLEQARLQLTREPLKLPTLKFAREVTDIDDFVFEDFIIEGYEAHPHIAGKVAV